MFHSDERLQSETSVLKLFHYGVKLINDRHSIPFMTSSKSKHLMFCMSFILCSYKDVSKLMIVIFLATYFLLNILLLKLTRTKCSLFNFPL